MNSSLQEGHFFQNYVSRKDLPQLLLQLPTCAKQRNNQQRAAEAVQWRRLQHGFHLGAGARGGVGGG
jgi:hypothetical protein